MRTVTWRAEEILSGTLQCIPAVGFESEAQLAGEGEESYEMNIDSEKKWDRVDINNLGLKRRARAPAEGRRKMGEEGGCVLASSASAAQEGLRIWSRTLPG